jgi:23S rRNA (cytidine1920-2'-O)/16S rRNA (cytidine1409-2'-O)-methyltransferase
MAVRDGLVFVRGAIVTKAGSMVATEDAVALSSSPRPFVSRGGSKLAAALGRFDVDPAGRVCLDAGASTGGFTDCLLQRGAAHVVAVDVGYGQLAWTLRSDSRVTVLERTNVRDLDLGRLAAAPDLVVADLSFISLRLVAGALVRVAAPGATFVLLVKPQFEAGRGEVGPKGVVRDPAVWLRVLQGVRDELAAHDVRTTGAMASPLLGPAGNVEFFLHAGGTAGESPDAPDLEDAVAEGTALVAPSLDPEGAR